MLRTKFSKLAPCGLSVDNRARNLLLYSAHRPTKLIVQRQFPTTIGLDLLELFRASKVEIRSGSVDSMHEKLVQTWGHSCLGPCFRLAC